MQKETTKISIDEAVKERIATKTLHGIEGMEGNLVEVTVSERGIAFNGRLSWKAVRRIGGRVGKILIACLIWAGWENAPHIVELIKRVP